MTRVLSELLGATEPMFHRDVSRLEAVSGHTSTDIRLTAEIERATKSKLRELGLDPKDTTGVELYQALQQRVQADDARLLSTIEQKYDATSPKHVNISKVLSDLPISRSCFALKTAVGKRILVKMPPKQAMKALGYRSFDSMTRREPLFTIFAAAWLVESASWRKALVDSYKKLSAADFEIRQIAVVAPDSSHWRTLAERVVTEKKHTVVGLKEFGAVVILPFPKAVPPAMTMTTLLIALHEINEVRSGSTFLKLCQVRPDFGRFVQAVVADEPALGAELLGGPVPWHIIQRYYSRFGDRFREEVFEPHVQREDLTWHSVERALSYIDPSLAFWHHTSTLGVIDNHRPVSMNIIDAALNFCNQLPYHNRIARYFQNSLWSELIIRYLKHDNVEQTVLDGIESKLVDEP